MKVVNTHEAKTHLSRLLDEAAGGADIVIAKAGRPVARLVRYAAEPTATSHAHHAPLPTAKVAEETRLPLKTKVTYWRESDGTYLGYLNNYPDHWTQGKDLDDLKLHLRDLMDLFNHDPIPGIRKEVELEFA